MQMSYNEFNDYFEQDILPLVIEQYGPNDVPARREAWNDLQDAMGRDGELEDGWEDWPGIPDELEE